MQTQSWLPYRTVYPPPEHTACDDLRVVSGLSAPHSSPRDILVLVPPTGGEGIGLAITARVRPFGRVDGRAGAVQAARWPSVIVTTRSQ